MLQWRRGNLYGAKKRDAEGFEGRGIEREISSPAG